MRYSISHYLKKIKYAMTAAIRAIAIVKSNFPYFLSISERATIFLILWISGTNISNSSINGKVSGINKLTIKHANSMYQGKQQYTIAMTINKITIFLLPNYHSYAYQKILNTLLIPRVFSIFTFYASSQRGACFPVGDEGHFPRTDGV